MIEAERGRASDFLTRLLVKEEITEQITRKEEKQLLPFV